MSTMAHLLEKFIIRLQTLSPSPALPHPEDEERAAMMEQGSRLQMDSHNDCNTRVSKSLSPKVH
jgi:hypothetical protein